MKANKAQATIDPGNSCFQDTCLQRFSDVASLTRGAFIVEPDIEPLFLESSK